MVSLSNIVLLTGANGFTGRYVARELTQAGYKVVGLCNGYLDEQSETQAQIQADLSNLDQLRTAISKVNPQYIIHLAAISSVQHASAHDFYHVNVIGTLNLLQAILDVGCQPKKVIIASSANVYGNGNNTASPITENQQPEPVNHYACSKLAMEYMVKTYCDRLPIVITRPFNYTGVGQSNVVLIPKIVEHFRLKKTSIELGNTHVVRDFSDVRTIAHLYRLLMESDQQQGTVNLCSETGSTLTDILNTMAELAEYEIKVHINPAFVRANEVHCLIGSNALLKTMIADYPAYQLHETLEWMYRQ